MDYAAVARELCEPDTLVRVGQQRSATGRAYARATEIGKEPVVDEAEKRILFGQDSATVCESYGFKRVRALPFRA